MGAMGGPAEIGIIVYPGAQLAAVHGLTDLFRIADTFASQARGDTGSALHVTHWTWRGGGAREMECAYSTDRRSPARPAVLILPPTLTDLPDPDTSSGIALWLTGQHEQGARLISICSGIFLVAQTGLLDGRIVSTHRSCAETLIKRFPRIGVAPDQRIIEYPGIMTAGGFLAWLDVGLALVAELLGHAVQTQTAQFILSDSTADRKACLPDCAPCLAHTDMAVRRAQELVHVRDGRDVSLASMAAAARLERRTFIRRFATATGTTPIEYCRAVRIARARELLEAGLLSTKEIASALGYADAGVFARAFRRSSGMPPGVYRRQSRAKVTAQPLET